MKKIASENVKNVFMVVSSNFFIIMVQLLMGFVLPKQLGVVNYAYYRVYYLYVSYAGLMHLGFVNGIYLKYGSYNKDELPVEKFRGFGRIMFALQLVVAAVLTVLLVLLRGQMDTSTMIAYAFVIVNIPLINIKWFYSSINQFTKRFVSDSYVTYLQNVLMFCIVMTVVIGHWHNFIGVLILTTIMNLICMLAVMGQNWRIIAGSCREQVWQEATGLIKNGFFLMLSEFVAIIILGIDSIFVQNLFSVEDFAMYSFAVSLLTVIYALISTVSNLVYPYLARVSEEKYAEYYSLMSDVLCVVTVMSLIGFYVAKFIVDSWMQEYTDSIPITAVLFGTIIFRSLIMLVCGNYFKVLKMIREYTVNNIFAITISFVLNLIAYFLFKDYLYIALASLLSFIIWYLVTDYVFIKKLAIPLSGCLPRYICITLALAAFYLLLRLSGLLAAVLYFVIAAVICVICFHRQFKKLLGLVKAAK